MDSMNGIQDQNSTRSSHSGKNTLHFGAMVYLCFQQDNSEEFYTTAEGFTKNKIRLKQASTMEKDGNFTSGLFKIFPPFYNSEYLKTKEVSNQKKNEKRDKHKAFNRRVARQEIPKQIKLMEEEASLNYDQYEKLKGTPVLYGQTIQLLHHNSNKYLQFDQKSVSDFESDNLKVSLSEEYSEETQFRILPCFSFQQESQGLIFDQDTVFIVSTIDSRNSMGDPYLHASKGIAETQDSKKGKKKEMNVSTDKKTQWKIKIFCNYNDERNGMLSVCDIIWINYSEKDLNLLVEKLAESEKSEKNLLKFEDCDQTEKYKKFVGNSNGMFVVESENMQQGGLIQWENTYRLRHLTTNQYLSVVVTGTSETAQEDRCLVLQSDQSKVSQFQFELIYSTLISRNRNNLTKYMQRDSYFRLSTKSQGVKGEEDDVFWLKTSDTEEFQETIREYHDVPFLNSNEKQIFPAFSTVKKEENVFKLNKASANEVRMTQFLLSCRKTIKKTFVYLDPQYIQSIDQGKFQQKYKKFLVMIGRLDRCLLDLNRFCHNKLKAYLYIDQQFGSINSFIQNVLREQLFIELLVQLLALSFPKVDNLNDIKKFEEQKMKKQAQEAAGDKRISELDKTAAFNQEIQEEFVQKKKIVATYIYKLLASICTQNRKNQERTASFLPLFAMQSRYIPGCMDCIFSIIKDFGDLLQNQLQTQSFDGNSGTLDGKMSAKQTKVIRKFHTSQSEINKISKKYEKNYEQVTRLLKINPQGFCLEERWDMFEFFCYKLIETTDEVTKRELLRFLGFASTDKGDGVNENQELIYKYLIPENEDFMYDRGYLIRIKSEGPELLISQFQRKLVDVVKKQTYMNSKKIRSIEADNSGMNNDEDTLLFFNEQMEFFANMCNKRNNTWKKFVDKSCKFESLAKTIVEEKITFNIRAIICQLLNKLYVDQEPKRVKFFPELCKILVENNDDWNIEVASDKVEKSEDIDIKDKLLTYIKAKSKLLEDISENIKMDRSNKNEQEEFQKIQLQSSDVYNALTYEIVKMLRLMTDFGKYNIHSDVAKFAKSKEKFNLQSCEFFLIIQNVLTIFEFDKTFPEARKVLLNKRQEDKLAAQRQFQEQGAKTIMQIFNFAKDFVGFTSDEETDKKKKSKGANFEMMSEDINISDSFLKQTDVLRKILQRFFNDNTDDIEFKIKQEICEILKQLLNYIQDYMLNRLKYQFSYLVKDKLGLIKKLAESKGDKTVITQHLHDFKQAIADNIDSFIPSVLMTGTEIDKKQQYVKQFQSKTLFSQQSNFANLANFSPLNFVGGKTVKELKDGEVININKILGFPLLPSLVLLFSFTQNYQMENKLLEIMTRFYNQRQEFAQLTSSLVILFDSENQKVLDYTKDIISSRLDKNVNESETWMKNLSDQENMRILKQTTEDFQFFGDILKLGTKAEVRIDEYDKLGENKGIKRYSVWIEENAMAEFNSEIKSLTGFGGSHIGENLQVMDSIRQDIFYHNKVHELAINLVKDSIYVLEDLGLKSRGQPEGGKDNTIFKETCTLFKTCMQFLTNFVHKNTVNQDLLSECLEKLYKALHFDIGLMELYWEIFRDNKKICLEHQERICEDFIGLIQKNGRQARYLEFFIIIQKAGEDYLLVNQKLVLNSFLNERFKRDLLYILPTEKLEFDFTKRHPKDEPYLYHAKLVEMLAMTTIGKEGMYMSESKLRQQLTLRYAFQLLSSPDDLVELQGKKTETLIEIKKESSREDEEEENEGQMSNDDSQNGEEAMLKSSDREMNLNKKKKKNPFSDQEENDAEEEKKNDNESEPSIDVENYQPETKFRQGFQSGQLIDSKYIAEVKIPLLKYIYFTFLESEKIQEEFSKNFSDFIDYLQAEIDRLEKATFFTDQYFQYLNQLFFLLSQYKRVFAISGSVSGSGNNKGNLGEDVNRTLAEFTKTIISKDLLFMSFENYNNAINRENRPSKIPKDLCEKYRQRWRIFRSLIEGQRSKAVKMEEMEKEKTKLEERLSLTTSLTLQKKKTYDKRKQTERTKDNLGINLLNQLNVFGIGKKEELETDPDFELFEKIDPDHVVMQKLWDVFLDEFLNSKYLKSQIDVEHTIFAQALDKVEVLFKDNSVVNEIINKNEIFKKLISFLQKAYKESNEIGTFKLILNCLSNFIQPPQEESKAEGVGQQQQEEEKEQLESNQSFLNQNNATYMLMNLLSDHGDPKINDAVFGDLINFGMRLLEEGNIEVQKSIYSYFMNFTSSEVFFKRVHTMLSDEIVRLKRGIVDNTDEDLYHFQKKEGIILSVLRFLQLFAEGHNLDLQKYMRLQTQNYHNFDLIEVIIELLNNYFKKKSLRYIKSMTQCLDTLTEYIQGPCKENQHALIQDNFLDLASSLLGIDEIMDEINLEIKKEKILADQDQSEFKDIKSTDQDADNLEDELLPRWEISKLKYKCSITLISLLEARSKEDDIVPRMMKTLNIDIIRRNITDIYNQYIEIGKREYNKDLFNNFDLDPEASDKIEHRNKCSFIIETGFNLYILLSTFKEVGKDEEEQQLKRKKKKDGAEEDNLLQNNIVSELLQIAFRFIEGFRRFIQDSANQVGNMMKTKQKQDWNEKKQIVKNNRDLLQDEALKFFEKHTLHIEVLRENDNQLEKTYFYLPYFCQDLDKDTKTNFNRSANRISVKAKVTSLMNSSEDLIKKMKHNYQLHKGLEKIPLLLFVKEKIGLFRNLAFILAIVINIMVLFSFERVTNSNGDQESVNSYTEQPIRILGIVLIVLSVIVVMYFLALNAPLLIMKAWDGPSKHTLFEYLLRLYTTVMNLLSDFYVLYYVIYGITAVVGTIVSPFFFFFHLFDVLVRSPDLLNVVQAVWIPKKSILFTYFLFLVLMYVFTLFGYYWLKDSYPDDFCESTFVCLITAIDRSFKFDGGLGGYLNSTLETDSNSYFLVRFFFDNIYFILLMIIMINIVSGIIIDQFGEGRDQLKEYNEDLMFKCFICGFSNEEIEKNSDQNQDFKSHIKEDHYMWNYLYYIAYLKDKAPTEYTGIESYVADKLDKKEITWFPTNRAMCMNKNMSIKQNQEIFNSLQEIAKSQDKIRSTLDNVNSTLDQFQIDYQGELMKAQLKKEEAPNRPL